MTIAARKAAARTAAFAARAAVHGGTDPRPAQAAMLELVRAALPAGGIVSGYVPIRTEIDPMPILAALHAEGIGMCLPVVEGRGTPLSFRGWRPGAALLPGVFGTLVPEPGPQVRPNVLIVPLLAFDRQCHRLGYGGGYYDRTLARLRAQGQALAFGLAYSAQEVESLPLESTDAALDAVVTEAGVIRPGSAA